MTKPFERWLTQEVEMTFGAQKVDKLPLMTEWLSANKPSMTDADWQRMETLRKRMADRVDFWNEDELKLFFMGEFVSFIDFNKDGVYSTFSQRTLTSTTKDVKGQDIALRGRVEWLVATGKQIPIQPFFFLHEYKPQLKTTAADPLGQLLIAMLATSNLNGKPAPLFGAYVLGRFWFFVLLDGKKYAVSRAFDATDEGQYFQIIAILQRCKKYIEDRLNLSAHA